MSSPGALRAWLPGEAFAVARLPHRRWGTGEDADALYAFDCVRLRGADYPIVARSWRTEETPIEETFCARLADGDVRGGTEAPSRYLSSSPREVSDCMGTHGGEGLAASAAER
jgi:hypothetical protein